MAHDTAQARGVQKRIRAVLARESRPFHREGHRAHPRKPGRGAQSQEIEATIENAKRFLAIQKKHGSFNRYLASLPDDLPSLQKIFRAEFVFMGPKIAEAYLESVGRIPEPHDPRCWRAKETNNNSYIIYYI